MFSGTCPTKQGASSLLALLVDEALSQENLPSISFHLGDAEDGADFSAHYPKFSDIQAAYATFLNEALAHDDNMEALARADNISDRHSGVDEAEGNEDIQGSEEKAEDGWDVQSDEEESQNDPYIAVQEKNTASDLAMSSELIQTFDYSLLNVTSDVSAVSSVLSTLIRNIKGHNAAIESPEAARYHNTAGSRESGLPSVSTTL
ncbi:hypothetical protein EV424DRAFT_1544738 [Suillus variegatus]|nr:hypothetical protein EV424DRAFT_1544738 [Suillus variegatus]